MNNTIKFSIIVPCCNVGDYILPLVKSIREQTYTNFECLLMIEESTDNTLELCQQVVAEDSRFSLSAGPRSGSASLPRNLGIKKATGEYAVFADGDDWLEPDSLERFAAAIEQHGPVDLIEAAASEILEDDNGKLTFDQKRFNYLPEDDGKVMTGKEATVRNGQLHPFPYSAVWMTVYRIDYLRKNNLEFIPGIIHEDNEWCPRILFLAEKVLIMDYSFYNYRRHTSSIMGQLKVRDMASSTALMRSLFAFYAKHQKDVTPDVAFVWQRSWLSLFYYIFFKPENQHGVTETMRKTALKNIFANEGLANFRNFMRIASRPKKIAAPFILFGRWWTLPACLFFKYIYYPLVERRSTQHENA